MRYWIFLTLVTAVVIGCDSETPVNDSVFQTSQLDSVPEIQEMDNQIPGAAPSLFREKDFDCNTLADAVNHYVALGEAAAVRELNSFAQPTPDFANGIDINERIGWVCRILFEAKNAPIRQPGFGGLGLPYRSMPLVKWPLYPVAKSGDTYCVLAEGYSLAGEAEPVSSYISHCAKVGSFRTERVQMRSEAQATADLNALRLSQRWLEIEWEGKGPGYSFFIDEKSVWNSIIRQAKMADTER